MAAPELVGTSQCTNRLTSPQSFGDSVTLVECLQSYTKACRRYRHATLTN